MLICLRRPSSGPRPRRIWSIPFFVWVVASSPPSSLSSATYGLVELTGSGGELTGSARRKGKHFMAAVAALAYSSFVAGTTSAAASSL
ncbi:hypothetical protein E2562_016705 [Oryza meyeriana var. granulata]|uniref:Uncharacterized protein n=1 Tax=Oryza meyeriana var. granulata TaxID=110450 RepID=A0A6G1EL26_9ORYZ|nr:hypothetical protein E2562_016705 [Oryza meyeriana var. granulata]